MQADQFHDRIDAVRRRFAASLEDKIKETYAQLPMLTGSGADVVGAVEESYRRIHGICGVGASLGFVGTGRAAKEVEDILIGPFRGRRGLAAKELATFERALGALSAAAAAELAAVSSAAKTEG